MSNLGSPDEQNFCASCGTEWTGRSRICPVCDVDQDVLAAFDIREVVRPRSRVRIHVVGPRIYSASKDGRPIETVDVKFEGLVPSKDDSTNDGEES